MCLLIERHVVNTLCPPGSPRDTFDQRAHSPTASLRPPQISPSGCPSLHFRAGMEGLSLWSSLVKATASRTGNPINLAAFITATLNAEAFFSSLSKLMVLSIQRTMLESPRDSTRQEKKVCVGRGVPSPVLFYPGQDKQVCLSVLLVCSIPEQVLGARASLEPFPSLPMPTLTMQVLAGLFRA